MEMSYWEFQEKHNNSLTHGTTELSHSPIFYLYKSNDSESVTKNDYIPDERDKLIRCERLN